jgi:hypothetical protein
MSSSLRFFIDICLAFIISVAALLGVAYLTLATIGLAPGPGDCLSETLGKISHLSSIDIEIDYTNCDALAKDESIRVFASKHGRTRKVLLFKYDPGGDEPPVITSLDPHAIEISVPRVSQVFFRREDWDGLSVHYKIGIIDYPVRGR